MKKLVEFMPYTIVACLTIGLAPFSPEPHIIGKLRWVAGGAIGMQAADWIDLFMHGSPFILLMITLLAKNKIGK